MLSDNEFTTAAKRAVTAGETQERKRARYSAAREWGDEEYKIGRNASTEEKLLRALRRTKFQQNKSRRPNVKQESGADNRGFCVGAIKSYACGVMVSRATTKHTPLTKLLCSFIRCHKPAFPFTSVQINKNCASALHIDNSNLGPSYIYGLGDYTGGLLYIDGEPRGKQVQVRRQWCKFDGNIPHLTCPFEGERYTIIYFTNQSYGRLKKNGRERLIRMGFKVPHKGLVKADYGTREERMDAARSRVPSGLLSSAGNRFQRLRTTQLRGHTRQRSRAKR